MSENKNRRTADFAKYDTMTTEELEEILRLDSEAPEDQESDGELLLYVMEVLARRKQNSVNPGKTAQQAWESFEKHYLPAEEATTAPGEPKKVQPRLRRWIAAVAAVAVLAMISLTASALTWEEIWDAVGKWTKNTFSFVSQPDATMATDPSPTHFDGYESLQQTLIESNQDPGIVPTRIPDGFKLDSIRVDQNPMQRTYLAFFKNEDRSFQINLRSYLQNAPEKVEISDDLLEIYKVSDTEYYIFANNKRNRAVWLTGSFECNISGDLTIEEIKLIIDSIRKG